MRVNKHFGVLMKTTCQSKLFFWTKIFIAVHLNLLYQLPQVFSYYAGHLEFTFWLPGINCRADYWCANSQIFSCSIQLYWYSIFINIWSARHLEFTFWFPGIIITDNQCAGHLESTFGLPGIYATDNQSAGHLEFRFWLPGCRPWSQCPFFNVCNLLSCYHNDGILISQYQGAMLRNNVKLFWQFFVNFSIIIRTRL